MSLVNGGQTNEAYSSRDEAPQDPQTQRRSSKAKCYDVQLFTGNADLHNDVSFWGRSAKVLESNALVNPAWMVLAS